MIIVFKHLEMSNTAVGQFYDSLHDFLVISFDIKVNDRGYIYINNELNTISYNPKDFSKEEIVEEYAKSLQFKQLLKSEGYTIYTTRRRFKRPFELEAMDLIT